MIAELKVVLEILAGAVLGGIIGIDREIWRRPAGLRTNMLVAASAALMVAVGISLAKDADLGGQQADPVRIIQAVIAGISFLGAGTIFRSRQKDSVEGLTTAATLLVVAGIGVAVALQQWITALGATAIAVLVLRGMSPLERWLQRRYGKSSEQMHEKDPAKSG